MPVGAGSYTYYFVITAKPCAKNLASSRRMPSRRLLKLNEFEGTENLSFHEDAELSCEGYRRIDALIKHLLVGHDGEPCSDGDRPIVRSAESESVKM